MGKVAQKDRIEDSTAKKIQNYIYKYSDLLGKGNFGSAYRGFDVLTGNQVAVKVIKMSSVKSLTSRKLLENEIQILKGMRQHPNILKCCGAFVSINNCYIITQLCEYDLQKQLKKKGKFPQAQIKQIVLGIYKGLEQLSKKSIIHRDIKVSNIFLTKNRTPKIADFGFAIQANESFKDNKIGSPVYMSPEGLMYQEYGPKTDVWSFGVLIYQLLFGETPLSQCKTQAQLKTQILQLPTYHSSISPQLKQVIEACLTVDPLKRPNILQLGNFRYFQPKKQASETQKIPKLMKSSSKMSTESSVKTSSGEDNPYFYTEQLSYENVLSLLHYCRLLHKINKKFIKSNLLSQFVVNFSGCLCNASFQQSSSSNEQLTKLKRVLCEYKEKFSQSFEDMKLVFNPRQVLAQISKSIKLPKSKQSLQALQVLDTETKILIYSLEHQNADIFTKNSESKIVIQQCRLAI